MDKPKGLIKRRLDDFIVLEIDPDGSVVPLINYTDLSNGHAVPDRYTKLIMTKAGVSAERAQEIIAGACGISPNQVEFYGKKDARAVTSQIITVPTAKLPTHFQQSNIYLQHFGYAPEALKTAHHTGNHFNILVVTDAKLEAVDMASLQSVPNFFGPQRFRGEHSWQVGRFLFEGNFEEAAKLLCDDTYRRTLDRALASHNNNLSRAWLSDECARMLKFSLTQWKSYLWNQLLTELIAHRQVPEMLPSWSTHPRTRRLYRHLWNPDVSKLDPWVLDRGHDFNRPCYIKPADLQATQEEEGIRFSFNLRSGAYATTVLAEVFDLREATE